MVDDGQLGEIHAVEASCLDPQDKDGEYRWNMMDTVTGMADTVIAFYVTFSQQSGGIFVDAGIHIVSDCLGHDVFGSNIALG
jgi:myo-inositol 2-dehydrogenase/D-chiro-inositol 1-dehydrogenase